MVKFDLLHQKSIGIKLCTNDAAEINKTSVENDEGSLDRQLGLETYRADVSIGCSNRNVSKIGFKLKMSIKKTFIIFMSAKDIEKPKSLQD